MRLLCAICVSSLLLVFASAFAFAQGFRDNQVFRESVTLDLNTQAVKSMQSVKDLLVERRWDQAVPVLQQLIENHGDTLVAVETGRYWNVADVCHWMISTLPPDFMQPYRQRVDGQANEWLATARQSNDEQILKRIVRRAFCSSAGDDALWLLGELAFERSEYAVARQAWERLVPAFLPIGDEEPKQARHLVYPDSSFPLAEVRARLVLCSIFDGQHERAKLELASFARLHPKVEGELLGTKGVLAGLLQQQFVVARRWEFHEAQLDGFNHFGGSNERNQPTGPEHYIGDRVWDIKLPRTNLNLMNERPNHMGPLSYFPLVNDDKLFLCDAYRVFAFDLATGKPCWGVANELGLEQPKKQGALGEIYNNSFGFPILPGQSAGVVRYAMTISDGRLYARMGPPFLRKSRNESSVISEIVGLDISQSEGAIVFRATSDVLDEHADSPEATKWCFEGTPVVQDGRIYVTARRSTPEDEIMAVCFDETGQLIWTRRVCVSLLNSPDHFNLIGHRLLTWGNGQLFVNTGTGAIAALNATDGKINWVVTYRSKVELTRERLSNPKKIGMETCLYHQGVVFVAPADSSDLFALEASTGHVLWHTDRHDRVLDLLGVVDNRLILGGLKSQSVDTRTGQLLWECGHDDADAWNYGRGWLTKDHLYRPTRTRIEKISLRTGNAVQIFDLKEQAGRVQEWGGNLLVANGLMIVAQPDRVIAFGEHVADQNARPKQPDSNEKKEASDQQSNPDSDAQAAIESGNMAALWSVASQNSSAGQRAEWLLLALPSVVPHRPWEAIAAINEELRNKPFSGYANELRLARAALLESLASKAGNVVSPIEQAVRLLPTYSTKASRPVPRHAVRLQAVRKDCWTGASPFKSAADRDWFQLTKITRSSPAFNLHLHRELPMRHVVRVEQQAGGAAPDFAALKRKVPWPVRRLWSHDIVPSDEDNRVHFVQCSTADSKMELQHSVAFAAAPIVLIEDQHGIAAVDPANGAELWTIKTARYFSAFAHGMGLVVLAGDDSMQARDSRTGKLVWRTKLRELDQRMFFTVRTVQVTADCVICVGDRELICLDLADGKIVWRFDSSAKRWSVANSKTLNRPRVWQCDEKYGLFLPKGSAEYFRVELSTGVPTKVVAIPALFPRGVDLLTAPSATEWWIAGESPYRNVIWGLSSVGHKWEHPVVGNAHGQPVILHDADHVIVIENNLCAVSINHLTGKEIWKTPIHAYPVDNPKRCVRLIDDRLVVVSGRSIRAMDSATGREVWKQPLAQGEWSLTSHRDHIIAVSSSESSSRLVVFNGTDGTPIQSLTVSGRVTAEDIVVTAQAMFVHSPRTVACFVSMAN
jgi:outer membrane protein assembly factor BamB